MTDSVVVGVDVGGTFTDAALYTAGSLYTAKTSTTEDQSLGVVKAVEEVCGRADVEPRDVDVFVHGTTAGVNAVLEQGGADTALVTTEGFRDSVEIGRQTRPALYDPGDRGTEPLVPRNRRYTVDERTTVDGRELSPDESELAELASELAEADVDSVAVSLLHSYVDASSERKVAEALEDAAVDVDVSLSSTVHPEFREHERTSTAVVDAYVKPVVVSYLERLTERAEEVGLPTPQVMKSDGGRASPEAVARRPVSTLMSGPAAGVVAADAVSDGGAVSFDMGGTSADVSSVVDGVEVTSDLQIDGHPVALPAVDIETIGAGGGSVAWVDEGGALRVGPWSTGADPGPACYGRGGEEATVTDAACVLGFVRGNLGGEVDVDVHAAEEALDSLAMEAGFDSAVAAAAGVYRVANAAMARAIRGITVERGHDPRRQSLVAFGGAGPMHAAGVADVLDMREVVVPRASGVLSAYGLTSSDERHERGQTLGGDDPEDVYHELEDRVLADVSDEGEARLRRFADARYRGQGFELRVQADTPYSYGGVVKRFHHRHEREYGYRMDAEVEVVAVRVVATVEGEKPEPTVAGDDEDSLLETRPVRFPGYGDAEAEVHHRDSLEPGVELSGCVVEARESTVVVPPDRVLRARESGDLVIRGDGG